MDAELTTTDRITSDIRTACSDDHVGSIAPPKRARTSDHQGAQVRICSNRKHLTDDGRRASYRRGVAIEVDAQDPTLECKPAGDRRRIHLDRMTRSTNFRRNAESFTRGDWLQRRSPTFGSETKVGISKGEPCDYGVREDSRIYGSSVQRLFGRGRPGARIELVIEWNRRQRESNP